MPTQITGTTGVSQVQDGVIVNADVNNTANIAGSKILAGSLTDTQLANQTVTNAKLAFDGGSPSFRNKIINPGMRFDQRFAGTVVTIPSEDSRFAADRWRVSNFGTSSITSQRLGVSSPGVGHVLRVTGNAGNTETQITQRISGWNMIRFQNTMTLSWYAASNSLTTQRVLLNWNASGTQDVWSIASYTNSFFANQILPLTNTLTRYTITVTVPVGVTQGAQVTFLPGGSNPAYIGRSGDNRLLVGQTFEITGVQFEEGPVATPLEVRTYETELMLCQAYYEKSWAVDTFPSISTSVSGRIVARPQGGLASPNGIMTFPFCTIKRGIPTVTVFGGSDGTLGCYNNFSEAGAPARGVTPTEVTEKQFYLRADHIALTNVIMVFHYTADAEL